MNLKLFLLKNNFTRFKTKVYNKSQCKNIIVCIKLDAFVQLINCMICNISYNFILKLINFKKNLIIFMFLILIFHLRE